MKRLAVRKAELVRQLDVRRAEMVAAASGVVEPLELAARVWRLLRIMTATGRKAAALRASRPRAGVALWLRRLAVCLALARMAGRMGRPRN